MTDVGEQSKLRRRFNLAASKSQPPQETHRPKDTADVPPIIGLHEWRGHASSGAPWEVHRGDVCTILSSFQKQRFDCVITSPPYFWQRDYAVAGQIGLEKSVDEYVKAVAGAMDCVKDVLKKSGVLFLNLGDTYYSKKGQPKGRDRKNGARRFGLRAVDTSGLGLPRKTAIGMPWRVALEMVARGWTLRSPIIWHRNGSLPEPTAVDRPWRTYENIFLFTRSPRYFFNRKGLDGNEDIWTIQARSRAVNGEHSATFPEELAARCLSVGCPPKGEVLDPFAGSGTVLRAAVKTGRPATGVDISDAFCAQMVEKLKTL